jgi:hypothetical protein
MGFLSTDSNDSPDHNIVDFGNNCGSDWLETALGNDPEDRRRVISIGIDENRPDFVREKTHEITRKDDRCH